jgi:hypothetical protein
MCRDLQDRSFGKKSGHKSLWNFTKIIRNNCRSIPELKVDRVTLITERDKAKAIAVKFPRAHENTSQSPLHATIEVSCSGLHNNGFNVNNLSALTSPKEVKKIIKKLKNGKAPGFDGVPKYSSEKHAS